MQHSESTAKSDFCVWICCLLCILGALSVSSALFCLCIDVCLLCCMYVLAIMLYTILLGLVFFQIKFWENSKPIRMWAWDSNMSQALASLAGAVSSIEFTHDLDTLDVKPWMSSKQGEIMLILAILLKLWNGLMDLKLNFQGRQDHKLIGSHLDYKQKGKNPEFALVLKNLEFSEIRRRSGEMVNSAGMKPYGRRGGGWL